MPKTDRHGIVLVWDVGRVILEWNPSQLAKQLESQALQQACLIIFNSQSWLKYTRGDLSCEELIRHYAQILGLPTSTILELLQAAFDSLTPRWPLIQLILRLREQGYESYGLSNASLEALAYLNSERYRQRHGFRLDELFKSDQCLLSAQFGLAKPELAFYQYCEKRFALRGRRIIYIDDQEANLQGAKAAGWWRGVCYRDVGQVGQALVNLGLGIKCSLNEA